MFYVSGTENFGIVVTVLYGKRFHFVAINMYTMSCEQLSYSDSSLSGSGFARIKKFTIFVLGVEHPQRFEKNFRLKRNGIYCKNTYLNVL